MSQNIPLHDSIICINPDARAVKILCAPDESRIRDHYPYVFGACDPYWAECNAGTLIGELLVQAWQICIDYSLSPSIIHEELKNIIEYRDLMDLD